MNTALRLAVLLFTISSNLFAQSDLLFVLDASGSMAKRNNGETQIDAARKSLKSAISELPADINVGLRVYAHRVAQSNKEESCKDSELLIPISNEGKGKIGQAIDQISVKGYTPIAFSLLQAKNDFDITRESEKTIILLSDGEETCGGDPAGTVKQLIADGFKVKVHAIGFMVDENTARQLKAIADASGGKYFDAKSSQELTEVFKEATKQVKFVELKDNKYGEKTIKGGAIFEEAVIIEPNIEYKLEHVLKKNQYEYFAIDLKPGQEVTAEIRTYDKGITVRENGEAVDNNNPYAGIRLINSDKSIDRKESIIGAPFQAKSVNLTADKEGRYYLLVGSEYEPIHPDFTTFKFTLVSNGDLGSEVDAPASLDSALPVEYKRYSKNFLSAGDVLDMYALKVGAGESFIVGYMPNAKSEISVAVKVLGEFREEISNNFYSSGQGGKSEVIAPAEAGVYYIEVAKQYDYDKDRSVEYTIEFRKVEKQAATSN